MAMIFNVLRRTLKCAGRMLLWFLAITVAGTWFLIWQSGDPSYQRPQSENLINDVTQLNPIRVTRIITPRSVDEVVGAVKNSRGPLSIGGGRFSMGGQIGYEDSLHLDMRQINQIVKLDVKAKEITVQSGITWHKIQEAIDPHDLSIRIMQTYSNFTVGGSLSVNVHGRYMGEGPLLRSVKSIRLVLANGELINASPTENSDLFYGAIGGYGGLGVIVETTLSLADNRRIERRTTPMPITEYAEHFKKAVRSNPDIVFHNADIYPPDFTEVRDVSWYVTDKPLTIEDRLILTDVDYSWQPQAAAFIGASDAGKWVRQYVFDPVYYAFDRVVNRNWEASYDVRELEPSSREETTYVLREYFVPVEKFDEFVPKMRAIFQRHDVNVLNVSIRHAHQDPGALLAWAKTETFAFVVYYRQGTDQASRDAVGAWSREMIDAALSVDGSYYLPYQLYESNEQFLKAYPQAPQFFELKKRVDPEYRFRNKLWQHLYPGERQGIHRDQVKGYLRGEEQTFLSIPEWYLVFNPVEYAEHLKSGKSPSDFSLFNSIDQYWALYDRVAALTTGIYPENSEYMTMLNVIGLSTTVEFMWKGLYEGSVGRFTEWIAGRQRTPEEQLIAAAHLAYSQLIYDKAWYEFEFWPWVERIWAETDIWGDNFIRKTERKLFFSVEFAVKTMYAKLIGFGARTAYEPSSGLIHVTGRFDVEPSALPAGVSIVDRKDDLYLLALPRWGGFTSSVPQLVAQGFEFADISGNRQIVVSIVKPAQMDVLTIPGIALFEDRFIADQTKARRYQQVPVHELDDLYRASSSAGVVVEHIFDY